MIALNVYKNLCRVRPQIFAGSLAHLSNIVFNGSNSAWAERTDSRILEKSTFRQYRRYSSDSPTKPSVRLPPISDAPIVIWPTYFKTIRNYLFINMVVRPQFDNEFDMTEFMTASTQALYVTSNALAREAYDKLEGLVTDDVIQSLRQKISTLSDQQKELIAVNEGDVVRNFPHEVGIMYEGERDQERRFVEITVVYHILRGNHSKEPEEFQPFNLNMLKEYQERLFVCNYRFVREYTNGVDSPWMINMINHIMPPAL